MGSKQIKRLVPENTKSREEVRRGGVKTAHDHPSSVRPVGQHVTATVNRPVPANGQKSLLLNGDPFEVHSTEEKPIISVKKYYI